LSEQQSSNTAANAAESAKNYFHTLTGHEKCSVTGLRVRPEGGWSVLLDVVELSRIPVSTSVMATFRVDIDEHGSLCGCERLRRYMKGATDG
jgi:hypothetical protein